jgi:hypothetical protein
MKPPAARRVMSSGEERRTNRLRDRDRAPPLRTAFPKIEQIRIELKFSDPQHLAPSPQSFSFFPAANAFFRFACPCHDCDGEFDVGERVAKLAAGPGRASRSSSTQQSCQGLRARDRVAGTRCPITLDCHIALTAQG